MNISKHIFSFLAALMLLALFASPAKAQWMEPKRIKFGASAGFGGLHEWGKPSFDIHWYRTTLRLAPGLFYLSAGITQKLAWYRPKRRKDRVILMSLYYHNNYFLSALKQDGLKRDVQSVMFMPGIHYNLNHRGTYYFQASVGLAYGYERMIAENGGAVMSRKHHYLPMAELRIGGIILSRKEHHQKFKYFPRDAKRVKSRRLRFKQ